MCTAEGELTGVFFFPGAWYVHVKHTVRVCVCVCVCVWMDADPSSLCWLVSLREVLQLQCVLQLNYICTVSLIRFYQSWSLQAIAV